MADSPSTFQPKVVSPSNNRIHPSAISFGVRVFGLAFSSARAGSAAKNKTKARRCIGDSLDRSPLSASERGSKSLPLPRTLQLVLGRRRQLVLREPLE